MDLIAEIGGNHKGNFDLAKELVVDACLSKANIIKLQLYSANALVNKGADSDRHRHFRKFELTKKQYLILISIIKSSGKKFCASVWDPEMFSWVIPHVDVIKIGSGDITCLPLIEKLLDYKKDIVLSSGLCSEDEVDFVYSWISERVSPQFLREKVTLMQCTSMYPIPNKEANLQVLTSFSSKYKCKIGYSDHTMGLDAIMQAISMQVDSIEYHYTLDKADTSFRDNLVSLEKADVEILHLYISKIFVLLGSPIKSPTRTEIESNHITSFRRGCYAKKDLKKGQKIRQSDIIFQRPFLENSLSPMFFQENKKEYLIKSDIKAGQIIY